MANNFDEKSLVISNANLTDVYTASNKSIVIAVINGEFTVKRILYIDKKMYLSPDNKKYNPIEITTDMDFEIWGVVTHVIHQYK